MANKYLDGTGLTYFWDKVKKYITNYVSTAISSKADKVTSATNGNFAALDSNGNLTDSGHKHSDYLTEHQSLSNYVTLNGTQNITGEKTFVGTKRIKFKLSSSSDKLGFTCYNSSSAESGNFEADPANRAINFGIYSPDTKPSSDWLVGFKYLAKDSAGTVHKYGLRTPSRLGNSTYAEHYIPVIINNKEADNSGAITLTASDVSALPSSTVIPSAPGTLDTTATTAQSTNSSEALSGSITLHKISKTGDYDDLIDKPDGEDYINDINTYLDTELAGNPANPQYVDVLQAHSSDNTMFGIYLGVDKGTSNKFGETVTLYAAGEDVILDVSRLKGVQITDNVNTRLQYNGNDVAMLSDVVQSNWNETDTTSKAYIQNKPTIPSAPGTLDTTATTAQSTSSSEALSGSITLHKVSKTGNYSDLNNTPTDLTYFDGVSSVLADGGTLGDAQNGIGEILFTDDGGDGNLNEIKIVAAGGYTNISVNEDLDIYIEDNVNDHLQFNGEDVAFTSELGTKIYYGTCTTGASTNPKVCTVETFPTVTETVNNVEVTTPKVGTVIAVKFSNTNSSTSTTPQLNVNSLGAKRIYYNTAVLSDSKSIWAGYAARVNYYMWDGTYWVVLSNSIGNSNTTYSEISTSEAASTSSSTARLITGRRLNAFAKINNGVITIGSNSLDTRIPIEAPVDSTDPTQPLTTLTCEVGKYYRLDVPIEALNVTLPSITDTTHVLNIVINLTTDSRTSGITFTPPSGVTVSYHSGYSIEEDTEYELNLQFNGVKWIVSYAVVE